ncbi:MAG: sigma-54-dependent Fis family transcriptional regulator [Bacteroidetes bacterium]|nr:sigma-54-dependent Fis family transcriptional regulator [Bacteroidota bacterium]
MPEILVIDDESAIRETLKEILEYEKYTVTTAEDGTKGLALLQKGEYDAVLCDVKMPGIDGMELLDRAQALVPDVPFIMISGHGNVEMAIEATKKGAYDFITKPPDLNRLLITIRNAVDRNNLVTETKVLKRKVAKTFDIIGETPAIQKIKETIEKVAPTEARVLITGENGTGKELVCRWIHEKSTRAAMPLVEVNCASIPTELIESELFGHEKGSFTSAIKQRIGKFEQAHGGTLFLDEIGDMSMAAQAKVLRAIQEGKIARVGGDKEIKVDVRIVAATNKNLQEEIERGNFRMDLYHRLSVILIHVPTLNERTEDIALIADNFLDEICAENGIPRKSFTPDGYAAMKEVNWTGNIRELRNVVERLVILCGEQITGEDVYMYSNPAQRGSDPFGVVDNYATLQDFRDWAEKIFIERKLIQNNWNVAKTAQEIDIQRSHLYNKIEKYNLKRR